MMRLIRNIGSDKIKRLIFETLINLKHEGMKGN